MILSDVRITVIRCLECNPINYNVVLISTVVSDWWVHLMGLGLDKIADCVQLTEKSFTSLVDCSYLELRQVSLFVT